MNPLRVAQDPGGCHALALPAGRAAPPCAPPADKRMPCTPPSAAPHVGMTLAFTATAEPELAAIPATVVAIWPPFPSGATLVTLAYARPVRVRDTWIEQIEAFMSEVYHPVSACCADPALLPPAPRSPVLPKRGRVWRVVARRLRTIGLNWRDTAGAEQLGDARRRSA